MRLRRIVLAPNMHPSESLRAGAARDAQGADALLQFAGEQMDKALQLHNYATVSADNAEHRRFHAARAVSLLQSATSAAPPLAATVGGGGGRGRGAAGGGDASHAAERRFEVEDARTSRRDHCVQRHLMAFIADT